MQLHVNIDHVATLRQARGTSYPDPVWAASIAELAGADGITVHLREDRRHIQDRDVRILRQSVRGRLNLEMAATSEMTAIAKEIVPDIVTLVPEKREERTTEGGLAMGATKALAATVGTLREAGIAVSLFIDPTLDAVRTAKRLEADHIELHTGDYCNAGTPSARQKELERLAESAREGTDLALHVAAGHGLDYGNVGPIAVLPEVTELNIGHALISRAVLVGLDRATRDMIAAIRAAQASKIWLAGRQGHL